MPNLGDRLKNTFPTLILTSPAHPMMSGKYAIIEFTGRKSGRRYQAPIAYVERDGRLLLSTDSPWWKNLRGGAPVTVVLRGRRVTGAGLAITDRTRAAAILRALVDAIPSYAKPAELEVRDGRVSDQEIARAIAEGRVSIEVELDGAGAGGQRNGRS